MTKKDKSIALFHEKQVRRYFNFDKELWLAQVGYERIEETEDLELAIDRVM